MKKFKVLVIGLLLSNNRMAKAGDVVEENLLNGNVLKLVEGGYISEVKEKEQKPKADKKEKPEVDSKEKTDVDPADVIAKAKEQSKK